LKQKGTRRAIKALVTSYGIPESTLFIREYGTFQTPSGFTNVVDELKQNYKLEFTPTSNTLISKTDSSIVGTKAVQFNLEWNDAIVTSTFFTASNSAGDNFSIGFHPTQSNNNGYIVFNITSSDASSSLMTSSVAPIYSGEWSVMVQQTTSGSYELLANQFNRTTGEFDYQLSSSLAVTSSISQSIDNAFNSVDSFTFGTDFYGYLDELRMWGAVITDSNFEEHTKYPKSIKLDNALEIPSALKIRAGINQQYRTTFTSEIPNLVFNPQYATTLNSTNVSIRNWISYQRREFYTVPNIGESVQSTNKVRYGLQQLVNGNTLTPNLPPELESNREKIVTAEVVLSRTSVRDSAVLYQYRNVNKKLITVGEDALTATKVTPIKFIDGTFEILEGENLVSLNILSTEYTKAVFNESKEIIQDVSDLNELVVGFSPTEIVNQVIVQHFGDTDLVNEYGDPTNTYDNRYASLSTLFDNFFKDLSSNQKSKFFVEYIRNFDKTLFNNIKKFVPEKANLTTAIFIEPNLLDRSKAKRLGKSETVNLANQGKEIPPSYSTTPPSQDTTISNDPAQNDLAPITPLGDPRGDRKQPVLANPSVIISELISVGPISAGLDIKKTIPDAIQNPDDVGGYSNQSNDVITYQDSESDKLIASSKWGNDNIIVGRDVVETKKIFEVRKYDFTDRLNEIEAEIGALPSTDRTINNKTYVDLTREYKDKKDKTNKLFVIKNNYSGTKPGSPVTAEDYLSYSTLSDRGFGKGRNEARTVVKNGITYILDEVEVSSVGVSDSSTTAKTKQTRVIVSGPDEDIKLTVD